jgi:ABC-type multidrug transport system ATPase subunit
MEMLKINHLTKRYKGSDKGVTDVTIHVQKGDIFAFIGHNGAGKTTTLKCITGIHRYDSGEILFKEGDVCESMFKVVEGSVSVQVAASNGDSIGLATLEKDKIFGEMAVFESWPRSATIVIREDHTKLLEIMRDEIRDFLREDPQQVKNIITNLSHRQKRLTEDFLHACNTVNFRNFYT